MTAKVRKKIEICNFLSLCFGAERGLNVRINFVLLVNVITDFEIEVSASKLRPLYSVE